MNKQDFWEAMTKPIVPTPVTVYLVDIPATSEFSSIGEWEETLEHFALVPDAESKKEYFYNLKTANYAKTILYSKYGKDVAVTKDVYSYKFNGRWHVFVKQRAKERCHCGAKKGRCFSVTPEDGLCRYN